MADWVPPWRPGLPQDDCAECETRVVAVTLDDAGLCGACRPRPAVRPRPMYEVPDDPDYVWPGQQQLVFA